MIAGYWYTFMTRFVLVLLFHLIFHCAYAREAGQVEFEISDRGFSHMLNYAIQQIDQAVKTRVSFRSLSSNAPKSDSFTPTGSLTYRVSLDVRELRFDCIDMIDDNNSTDLKAALVDLRRKLDGYGVRRLHGEVTVLIAVDQINRDISLRAKFYPSRLKIYADTNDQNSSKINILLDFLKDLILSRCQDMLLEGIASKYLRGGLNLGNMFSLSTSDFSQNKQIDIVYHMGRINDLNPISFKSLHTSNGKLHLIGTTAVQEQTLQ